VGTQPLGIFVNTDNTLYVAATFLNQILMWSEGSNTVTWNASNGLNHPYGIFATINGDVYVDNGYANGRVDKWALNTTNSVVVMNVTSRCISLFVDTSNTLYCSNDNEHKVVKTSLDTDSNIATVAAGNGTPGSGPYMLYYPNGIFVDVKFNLYVADYTNNRIQFFRPNQLNATTVAGNGAPGTITLACPAGIVLDVNGYMFIADCCNNRIVGSGPNGFRCLVGCSKTSGSASNQLSDVHSFSFDSYGDLLVADFSNNRIQKFLLTINSCGKYLISYRLLIC
jgi:hypothetical protein